MARGFLIDSSGDIVMRNGDIVLTGGDDLTRQTMQTVIGTNKGEWFNNKDEGIRFLSILGKNLNKEVIRDEIQQGIAQVDPGVYVDEFTADLTARNLAVAFKARRLVTDETFDLSVNYG